MKIKFIKKKKKKKNIVSLFIYEFKANFIDHDRDLEQPSHT